MNRTLVWEVQAPCSATELRRQTFWSRVSESNAGFDLTKIAYCHYTNKAQWIRRGDLNSRFRCTKPTYWPLYDTGTKFGGASQNRTDDSRFCRPPPYHLAIAPKIGAEDGTRTHDFDVGNVASLPLNDFRMERVEVIETSSRVWKTRALPLDDTRMAGELRLELRYPVLETGVLAAKRFPYGGNDET